VGSVLVDEADEEAVRKSRVNGTLKFASQAESLLLSGSPHFV